MTFIDNIQRAIHPSRLYHRRHNEHNHRLQRERRDERKAPQRARIEREAGEEEAAEAETDDGGEGFGPAVWLGGGGGGGGGGSETEEDGVARLHADEGAVGVVDGAVDETGDEGAG